MIKAKITRVSDLKDVKKVFGMRLRKDTAQNLWFVGADGAAVAYRYDGAVLTRFEFPKPIAFPHPQLPFGAVGGAVFLGTQQPTILRIEGDEVTAIENPSLKGQAPYTLASDGERLYCSFVSGSRQRTEIQCFEKGKWRRFDKPFENIRSLAAVPGRVAVIENEETSYMMSPDGRERKAFKTRRGCMKIVTGVKRFVTFCDAGLEVRDFTGKEVAHFSDDDLFELLKANSVFQCAAQVEEDTFLAFARDRFDQKKKGHLVLFDAIKKEPSLHPLSKLLQPKMTPDSLEVDKAGKVWLECVDSSYKPRLHILDGRTVTTIK